MEFFLPKTSVPDSPAVYCNYHAHEFVRISKPLLVEELENNKRRTRFRTTSLCHQKYKINVCTQAITHVLIKPRILSSSFSWPIGQDVSLILEKILSPNKQEYPTQESTICSGSAYQLVKFLNIVWLVKLAIVSKCLYLQAYCH